MACPIHIWVPLMAAAVPAARAARTRLKIALDARRSAATATEPREVRRWAPVGASQEATTTTSPERQN